jgi:hypothetical protein
MENILIVRGSVELFYSASNIVNMKCMLFTLVIYVTTVYFRGLLFNPSACAQMTVAYQSVCFC